MKKKHTFKERMQFRFDMIMSKGVVSKVFLLLIMTVIFVTIMAILSAVILGDIRGLLPWTSWKTLMYTLDPGNLDGAEGKPLYIAMMLVATFYGLFFTAVLIGLINDAISQKMDSLARSKGTIIASGHTVVLGFHESTFVILKELILANQNQKEKQSVIIMDDVDSVEMSEKISIFVKHIKDSKNTRVFCRSGSIYDRDDLEKCSIITSKSIIINTEDDFETTKAIIACTSILNEFPEESNSYTVAVIYNSADEDAAQIAGCDHQKYDRLVMLPLQRTLARIAVHTSRQPGLSSVFNELFNYDNNEFYIISNDKSLLRFEGKTIQRINRYLKDAVAVGLIKCDGSVLIADPCSVVYSKGDKLIVLQEDDEPIQCVDDYVKVSKYNNIEKQSINTSKCLVIGAKSITNDILIEESKYVAPGSMVVVADQADMIDANISTEVKEIMDKCAVNFVLDEIDDLYTKKTIDMLMDKHRPDNVLVLADGSNEDNEAEDEDLIKVQLYLLEYKRVTGHEFNVTSQLNSVKNQRLARVTGTDDFIISRHIAALIMTQISQNRELKKVFDILLDSEGYEVYMEKAACFVPIGKEIDMYSAIYAAGKQQRVMIGIRQMKDGRYLEPVVNPPKYDKNGKLIKYTFSKDDYFVVLAEGLSE